MCGVCGCSSENLTVESSAVANGKGNSSNRNHHHHPETQHNHADLRSHSHSGAPSTDEEDPSRSEHIHVTRHQNLGHGDPALIEIEQDILHRNSQYAEANRVLLNQKRVLCLNLVSSPGSGKTTLLEKTIKLLLLLTDQIKERILQAELLKKLKVKLQKNHQSQMQRVPF